MLNLSLTSFAGGDVCEVLVVPRQGGDGECLVIYAICPEGHPLFIGSLVVYSHVDTFFLKGLISFAGLYLDQECKFLLPLSFINPLVRFCCLKTLTRRQGTRPFHLGLANIPFLLTDSRHRDADTCSHHLSVSFLCHKFWEYF